MACYQTATPVSASTPVKLMQGFLLLLTALGTIMLFIGVYVHDVSWTPFFIGLTMTALGAVGLRFADRKV